MKWQVSCLSELSNLTKTYLCVGYKIADDVRMNRFNRLLKNNCHLIIEGLNGVIFHDMNGDLIAVNQKVASIFETTLANNIKALIEDIQLAGTLKFSFSQNIEDELLSSSKKITLFRIVQEQLKNIIKHSQATTTQISLQTKEDQVILVMKDNGKGFDPQRTRQGIGLSNIHERARFYNGISDIKSSPGAGCTLTVTIPVKEN